MKICVVFTPFSLPNFAPLGMASLKSFVEKHVPEARVKTIDCNLAFFERMRKEGIILSCADCPSPDSRCSPAGQYFGRQNLTAMRRRLQAPLRSKGDVAGYFRQCQLFYFLAGSVKNCFSVQLTQYLESSELTAACRTHLQDDARSIYAERPDVIGFSVFSTDNLLYTLAMAKMLKETCHAPIVLGGPLMAHIDPREIMRTCGFIDYIITGDGGEAFAAFLNNMTDKLFSRVPNLMYRRGRTIVATRKREDRWDVPFPDFGDLDLKAYWHPQHVLPVLASKGCSWGKCAFCVYTRTENERPVENVIDEIEWQHRQHGVERFFFNDLSMRPGRVAAISERIVHRGLKIRFGMYIRPESGLTNAVLQKAYDAGLRWALLGAESATPRLLAVMRKGTSAAVVRRIVDDCYRIGIRPYISYIIGLPTQTKDELTAELAFIRRHAPFRTISASNIFRLARRSRIACHPERFGIGRRGPQELIRLKSGVIHKLHYDHTVRSGISPDQALQIVDRATSTLDGYDFDHMSDLAAGCAGTGPVPFSNTLAEDLLGACRKADNERVKDRHYRQYLRGLRFLREGANSRALTAFDHAARKLPESRFNAHCALRAGDCLLGMRRYPEALDRYMLAERQFPEDGYITLKQAEVLLRMERPDAAACYARKAITKGYDIAVGYTILGKCYRKRGLFARAIRALREAKELSFGAEICFLLADCYRKTGDGQRSAEEMEEGCRRMKYSATSIPPSIS